MLNQCDQDQPLSVMTLAFTVSMLSLIEWSNVTLTGFDEANMLTHPLAETLS
jgi:hypothetical protein